MQNTGVADLLTPFCEAGSLNVRDVSRAVRKRILVSLSFADLPDLHAKLFHEHHMDWAGVNEYLQAMRKNRCWVWRAPLRLVPQDVSFTAQDWLQILGLVDFVQAITPPPPRPRSPR
jgi:hypothetical protein